MNINPIKTEQDYKKALETIELLLNAPDDTEEADELEILSILVDDYETKHHPIDPPDPIEALKCIMEQKHLTRKDLEKSIGDRGKVAQILNGKRKLSLRMIRNLHKNFNIPANILIAETKKQAS